MIDKVKKNWKIILIGFLLLFSMNKCTQSCSRGGAIKKLNTEIVTKDSIYNIQKNIIDSLSLENKALDARLNDRKEADVTYAGSYNAQLADKDKQIKELTLKLQKSINENNILEKKIKELEK